MIKAVLSAALLLWSPSPEPDFSHYIVFSGENPSQFFAYQTTTDTFLTGITHGHFYAVRAVDIAGNVSDFSNLVQYQETAMPETLQVNDSLRFDLVFSLPEQIDLSKLEIEHRFSIADTSPAGYIGQWRPLLQASDDIAFPRLGVMTVNVNRLREFLDAEIEYRFELRARYAGEAWVYHSEIIRFARRQNRLLKIIPKI